MKKALNLLLLMMVLFLGACEKESMDISTTFNETAELQFEFSILDITLISDTSRYFNVSHHNEYIYRSELEEDSRVLHSYSYLRHEIIDYDSLYYYEREVYDEVEIGEDDVLRDEIECIYQYNDDLLLQYHSNGRMHLGRTFDYVHERTLKSNILPQLIDKEDGVDLEFFIPEYAVLERINNEVFELTINIKDIYDNGDINEYAMIGFRNPAEITNDLQIKTRYSFSKEYHRLEVKTTLLTPYNVYPSNDDNQAYIWLSYEDIYDFEPTTGQPEINQSEYYIDGLSLPVERMFILQYDDEYMFCLEANENNYFRVYLEPGVYTFNVLDIEGVFVQIYDMENTRIRSGSITVEEASAFNMNIYSTGQTKSIIVDLQIIKE